MSETIQISGTADAADTTAAPSSSKLRHIEDIEDTVERDVHICVVVAILTLTIFVGIVAGPLAASVVLTLCGIHLVYTHLWAVATILAVCDQSCHEWMGVLTAMGIAITVPWYGLLLCKYKHDTVGRAISGWGRWIVEDVFGCIWPYDFHTIPCLIRLCYHSVDLAIHFLPTPWLLSRYNVTPLDCLFAFLISRLWSISASAFHITLDWTCFQSRMVPRVCARSQKITPFVSDGVVNDIYGLRPSLPRSCLHFLYIIEAVTLLTVAVAGAPSASMLLPHVSQIEGAMTSCISIGAAFGLIGVTTTCLAITKAR